MQKKTAFARGEYHSLLNNISRINWLFIMRLSVCCTAFLIFRTSGQSIKDTRIELQVRHESLKSALQKLQDMSGFSVFYPSSKVNTYQNITLVNKSRYVSETLDLLLKGTNLDYRQDGNTIIITEKKIATPEASERVVKRITGIVVDETGVPLAGVTIRLKLDKMASNGTDINGHFQMVVNQDNDVLIFSFVGYQTQEVPVSNIEQSLRVVMKPAVGGLNEVQIIGYGSTTRRLNTGTVSSITSEEISKQPVQNPLDALQGRIAGAIVNQANGLPGARVTIQIRGQNSLSNGTQPLYIIDGVPFNMQTSISTSNDINSTVFSAANGGISPFSVINPNDIERLDILKDADATAIYGTRGSNGVVLITTKRGKAGKTKFDVNVYHGVGKVAR
jgi:TonB-dependent SusC/RagA subfamily outer membrane receptor